MPLKVACIGAGYFSRFHYEAWARIPGVELIASVDRDIDKAKATGLASYQDISAMLAEQKPDIVDIITPPAMHLSCIEQTLESQPKAIICQKPFCCDIDEAHVAIKRSTAVGVPLVVHENFRFQPWYRIMKKLIDAGEIGDVLQLTFRLRPGDGQGPEAYLDRQPYFQHMPRFLVHETAVHWIDTFRYLLGEPAAVFADLRQINQSIAGEDAGFILFRYDRGVRALFDGNRLLDHGARNTRCTMGEALVEGTAGTLELRGNGSIHKRRFGSMDSIEILAPSTHEGFGGDCVYYLQYHVVEALNGNGDFENLAADYLPVLEQEQAIYNSADTGSWIELRQRHQQCR